MGEHQQKTGKQSRKHAGERSSEILAAANDILRSTKCLPIAMPAIAEAMSVSRALIYAYFTDHDELLNALTSWLLDDLERRNLGEASGEGPLADRLSASFEIYIDHIIDVGPNLHIILRDGEKKSGIDPECLRFYRKVTGNLLEAVCRELKMGMNEASIFLQLLIAIPEEAAQLIVRGVVDRQAGGEICTRLLIASIDSVHPTNTVSVS